MPDNFGLSYSELSEIRTINPELAAHNIALAYIQATAQVNISIHVPSWGTTNRGINL